MSQILHAVSSSGYSNGHETLPLVRGVSPACSINASIFPGSESENGPSAPGGGGGTHAITAPKVAACSQSSTLPHDTIATYPPALTTLLASLSALTGFSAYWKELNPVTTSNEPSAYGNSSISPLLKSPSGARSRAMTSSALEASMPVTYAPSFAASCAASPDPQPMSRRRVPLPTLV